jgi:hypothetical protein
VLIKSTTCPCQSRSFSKYSQPNIKLKLYISQLSTHQSKSSQKLKFPSKFNYHVFIQPRQISSLSPLPLPINPRININTSRSTPTLHRIHITINNPPHTTIIHSSRRNHRDRNHNPRRLPPAVNHSLTSRLPPTTAPLLRHSHTRNWLHPTVSHDHHPIPLLHRLPNLPHYP